MTKSEQITTELENINIKVVETNILDSQGLYLTNDENNYIVLKKNLSESKKVVILAHEIGHHNTGMDETKANRWAIKQLLKLDDIIMATINGCRSYYDLSEYLGLDEKFVRNAIKTLVQMQGCKYENNQYVLHLYPIWVEDKNTGQVWPDN